MTPQKARLLTISEIDRLENVFEETGIHIFPFEYKRLLATARAALEVVEEGKKIKKAHLGFFQSLKPFQQTVEDRE